MNLNKKLDVHLTSKQFSLHENYNEKSFGVNDIALIYVPTLKSKLEDFKAIKLPEKSEIFENLEGKDIQVMGYGKVGDFFPISSNRLKFVNSTAGKNEECEKVFGKTFNKKLHICMHTRGSGSVCQG